MQTLSSLHAAIYNDGERLIPGVTHDIVEVIRHESSYVFWKNIIAGDIKTLKPQGTIRILDVGCGVGHGCETLSSLPNVQVVGIDMSEESLEYARTHHSAPNITYLQTDIIAYVQAMEPFDYVISRGVIEHVIDGLNVIHRSRWTKRLMFDVPYDEPAGINPHHIISEITEKDFAHLTDAELYFQDLSGAMFDVATKPDIPKPNMIMPVCTVEGLPRVATLYRFPLPPVQPSARYLTYKAPPPPSFSERLKGWIRRKLAA